MDKWRQLPKWKKILWGTLAGFIGLIVLGAIFGEPPPVDAAAAPETTTTSLEVTTTVESTTTTTQATTTTTQPTTTTTTNRPGGDIEADIRYNIEGLHITVRDRDHTGCRLNLNGGLIFSGYTRIVNLLPQDEEVTVTWANLTNRDNERFNIISHAPDTLSIDCDDAWYGYWTFN